MNTFYFLCSWNDRQGNVRRAFAYIGVNGEVGADTIKQVIAKVESEADVKPGTVMVDFIYKLAN